MESYNDVLKPYSGVFLQFMELKSLKLDFQVDFFHIKPILLQIEI